MFSQRYCPNFRTQIATDAEAKLARETWFLRFKENYQLFRRSLFLRLSGQKKLELEYIPKSCQRILWINTSIRNIGDAVMNLSGRVLLKDKYQLDLLAVSSYAELFSNDDVFQNIYTDVTRLQDNYDLIILDTVKSRSLNVKLKYYKNIPFCHLRGHFDGIEFNWVDFSFHRINALLSYPYNQQQLEQLSDHHLCLPKCINWFKSSKPYIVIAVGGEDVERRSYGYWAEVIDYILTKNSNYDVVLVGSENGLEIADRLMQCYPELTNFVNQISLLETSKVIAECSIFIGCDGGLLHIAAGFHKLGVGLFGYFAPKFRLTQRSSMQSIYDERMVNNIPSEQLIQKINTLIDNLSNSSNV